MSNVTKLEDAPSRAMRGICESNAISFKCNAPYHLGSVGFARVGFADIPRLQCNVNCKEGDWPALVAVVRQHLIQAAVRAELEVSALDLVVHYAPGSRQRYFIDSNEDSKTHGKRKRGVINVAGLEIDIAHRKSYEDALPRHWGQE